MNFHVCKRELFLFVNKYTWRNCPKGILSLLTQILYFFDWFLKHFRTQFAPEGGGYSNVKGVIRLVQKFT